MLPLGFGSFFRQHKFSLGVGLLLLFVLPIAVFLAQNEQLIAPRAREDTLPQSRLFLESSSRNVSSSEPLKIDLVVDTSKDPDFVVTGVDAIITIQATERDKALVTQLLQNMRVDKGQAFETITKQEIDPNNLKIVISASNQSVKDSSGNPTGFTGRGTVVTLSSSFNTIGGGPTPPGDALPNQQPTPLTFRLSYSASDSTNDTNIVGFEKAKPVSAQSPRERFLSQPQELTLALGGSSKCTPLPTDCNKSNWQECVATMGVPIGGWCPPSSPSPSETPIICWNRVIKTDGGYAWPDGCKGNPQAQGCTSALVGLTQEELVTYNSWLTQDGPVAPGCTPEKSPRPTSSPSASCGNNLCEPNEYVACPKGSECIWAGSCPQDCAAGNKCLNGSTCSSGSSCPAPCARTNPPQCQPGVCPGTPTKSPPPTTTPTPTPKPQVQVQIQLTFEDRASGAPGPTNPRQPTPLLLTPGSKIIAATLYGVPASQVRGVSVAQGFNDVSQPIIITDPPTAFYSPRPRPTTTPSGAQTIAQFVTNSAGVATITVPERFYGQSYWLYVRTPSHMRRIATDGPYTFPSPVTCSPLLGVNCPSPAIRLIQFNSLIPGDIYVAPGASEQDNLINTFDATELMRHLNQRARPVSQSSLAQEISNSGISQEEQQRILSLPLPHPADLNGDGIVNTRDLAILVRNMGRTGDEFNQTGSTRRYCQSNQDCNQGEFCFRPPLPQCPALRTETGEVKSSCDNVDARRYCVSITTGVEEGSGSGAVGVGGSAGGSSVNSSTQPTP